MLNTKEVTQQEFINTFINSIYKDKFSILGLMAIYDYCIEQEKFIGEPYQFNIDETSQDYSEYENLKEFQESNYNACFDEYVKASDIKTLQELGHHTPIITIKNTDRFVIINKGN